MRTYACTYAKFFPNLLSNVSSVSCLRQAVDTKTVDTVVFLKVIAYVCTHVRERFPKNHCIYCHCPSTASHRHAFVFAKIQKNKSDSKETANFFQALIIISKSPFTSF